MPVIWVVLKERAINGLSCRQRNTFFVVFRKVEQVELTARFFARYMVSSLLNEDRQLPLQSCSPPSPTCTHPSILTWYVETPRQFSRVFDLVGAPDIDDDELVALYGRFELFELDFWQL